jgi:hypothetical protein
MSAENKTVIPYPRVSKELPNRINSPLLNGEKINTANGKKLDKVNGVTIKTSSERFDPALKETTMSVKDLLKEDGGEMFEKVFGATISEDRRSILFPESGAKIQRAPSEKGSAILTFQNGDKTELRSLNGWAARDAELNYGGPAVDLISPVRKNGSFEIVEIREGTVTHKILEADNLPSDPGEYFAAKVARELPKNEIQGELPSPESKRGKFGRDFPQIKKPEYMESKTAKETQDRIDKTKQEIKALRQNANGNEIEDVINNSGLTEDDVNAVEKYATARFTDILEKNLDK